MSLGRLAALSRFHFQRLFKAATGVTPSCYQIDLRMEEARRLLRETKMSVVDITIPLPRGEAAWLTAAVRARREVAGGAPLPEHLLDEAGADAELLGDLRDRATALLVGRRGRHVDVNLRSRLA